MEIHKPKAPHNVREFVIEIAVIVLGVLIALGAEQLVQMVEWRHKIEAAEEAMGTELRDDDGPQAYARYAVSQCLTNRLDEIRTAVESGADRPTVVRLTRSYKIPFWTWDSLALQSANASNVMTRMNAERAQRWTSAYAVIPALDRANEREFHDLAELYALRTTGGALSEDERSQLLRAVEMLRQDALQVFAAVRVFLPSIYESGIRLEPARRDRYIGLLRQLGYSDCFIAPPQPQGAGAQ
jgi:hypothetical protein